MWIDYNKVVVLSILYACSQLKTQKFFPWINAALFTYRKSPAIRLGSPCKSLLTVLLDLTQHNAHYSAWTSMPCPEVAPQRCAPKYIRPLAICCLSCRRFKRLSQAASRLLVLCWFSLHCLLLVLFVLLILLGLFLLALLFLHVCLSLRSLAPGCFQSIISGRFFFPVL